MQMNPPAMILENLTTSTLWLDEMLRLRYLNPSAEALIGLSAQQIIGRTLEEILPGNEHLNQRLMDVCKSGHPCTEREKLIVLPDGRSVTIDCTVTPLFENKKGHAMLLEIVQLDRQLRILREEHLLNEQIASQTMVRGFAHEVKNPLGGLRGAAQLLEDELTDEGLKEYTRIIIGEADRLHALVDRLLGPNNIPRKRALCIHEVLEHVRNLIRVEAADSVTISTDYDPSIPLVEADRDLLVQVFLNIAKNALEALGNDGEILFKTRILRQYTIGRKRHKLVIKADIIDNGAGIPDEIQQRIFFPMVSGRHNGSGLGLSIAQALINQHSGLIECISKPGFTEFNVLIPLEA